MYWPWSSFFRVKFWDRFIILFAELFCGSLRMPQKWQKLEPAKVDKSDTIFWTQKPEGPSHVEQNKTKFSASLFLVWKISKVFFEVNWLISWFLSSAVFLEGTKIHCSLVFIDKRNVFTALIKAKYTRQNYLWNWFPGSLRLTVFGILFS